jgi:hypothetical protein
VKGQAKPGTYNNNKTGWDQFQDCCRLFLKE